MHLVVIGDIGPVNDMIHIGDEAMFDEAVRQLRRRGVDRITAISSNPLDTAERYGVSAVLPLSRGGSSVELDELISDADGVLVSGGGNISSIWPTHIVERAEITQVAIAHDRPLVFTGQTIGPELTGADRATVSAMLGSARLVGTRESASATLVAELGVRPEHTQQNIDDASLLLDGRADPTPMNAAPYALVTVARHVGDVASDRALDAYAELLDAVVEQTGLTLVFHAHFASLLDGDSRGDSAVHVAIAERLGTTRLHVAPTTDVPTSARLARDAGLVVTSRYHPAVFAGPAGVPTIGIPVDDYTGIKLRGALGAFGQDGVLALDDLLAGTGRDLLRRVWSERELIRQRGTRIADDARPVSAAWWDRVRAAYGS